MSSQTARPPRRPDGQRTARSARAKRYVKQTAHVEARRDGKPLIFGWGGHLSRNEKNKLQRRAIWGVSIAVAVLIVAVIIISWVNINVITPGLAITSVNGQAIPQSTYRKLVALKAQVENNKIYGVHGLNAQADSLKSQVDAQQAIITNLNNDIAATTKKIQALPAGTSIERTNLTVQLDSDKQKLATAQQQHDTLAAQYQTMQTTVTNALQLYTQSQVGNDSVQWLQDDAFIRSWLANQNSTIQGQVNPSDSAVNSAVKSFIADFPKTTTYNAFLSSDNVSDADVHAMMALTLRRQNMQTYLASQIKSPAYAVLARTMTLDTQAHAQSILKQLKSGGDFAKLAKANSVDSNTKDKGGALDWLIQGQFAQTEAANTSVVVDNWMFDRSRKLNEISPILMENGAPRIVQILNINPAYTVDPATLKSVQDDALTIWELQQRALPGVQVTPADQTMLTDSSNMPSSLPSSAPAQTPPASGLPGGTLPGSGLPSSGGTTGGTTGP